VIKEESSILLEVVVSVIVRNKLHTNVSLSEWLPWYSCLDLHIQTNCEW